MCPASGKCVPAVLSLRTVQGIDSAYFQRQFRQKFQPMEELLAQMPGGANLKGVKLDEKAIAALFGC